MKVNLYSGLALDGIRKNKRMYLPYILTCIGMVMMYYIIVFLQTNKTISEFHGGENAQMCLGLGGFVIAFFACIFLFYTNSFLMKRRKKEFGLYNILGMERRHLGYILFWENLIVATVSLVFGLLAGIIFSKIAELGMMNMLKMEIYYGFSISKIAVVRALIVFGIIFFLLYVNAIRQIRFASAVSLITSDKEGEKAPKANWLLGILGLVILVSAYYIAITIKNPLAAISLFFVAVLMVIAGTYLVMIAGSVLLCKLLQKNKKYYYKKNHFVSVSSMTYRMKRNGAGLASICILSTMVLVMISSSSCLYFGSEDTIKNHYPREVVMNMYSDNPDKLSDDNIAQFRSQVNDMAQKYGATMQNEYCFRAADITGVFVGNVLETDVEAFGKRKLGELDNVAMVYFVPVTDLSLLTGKEYDLQEDEAILYVGKGNYHFDSIQINGANSYRIKEQIKEDIYGSQDGEVADVVYFFVKDLDQSLGKLKDLEDYSGDKMLQFSLSFNFDTGLKAEEQIAFFKQFESAITNHLDGFSRSYIVSREENRDDFFATFGGLFYLGIILSIVFIIAAVLIIYYKQISEGYEDQARFNIMQKVGMTSREIRSSIDSQMLTVFFFPLIMAGIHVCFAFPMIKQLLFLFSLFNVKLFVITSLISFLVFAFIYIVVYRFTSNAYYGIVSSNLSDK